MQYTLIPLYLVSLAGNQFRGRTRLQKLVFLVQKRLHDQVNYRFKPAQQGPLSYRLYLTMKNLQEMKLVKEVERKTASGNVVMCYEPTPEGKSYLDFAVAKKLLPDEVKLAVDSIYVEFGNLSYLDLITRVHESYPQFVKKLEF
jgi:uncharacterized protein YwgA